MRNHFLTTLVISIAFLLPHAASAAGPAYEMGQALGALCGQTKYSDEIRRAARRTIDDGLDWLRSECAKGYRLGAAEERLFRTAVQTPEGPELVERLVAIGINVNAPAPMRDTAFPNGDKRRGRTALEEVLASATEKKPIIGVSFSAFADFSDEIRLRTVEKLLAAGANPNARALLSGNFYEGGHGYQPTPLMFAARWKSEAASRAVAMLLERGADPNLRSDAEGPRAGGFGETALSEARRAGNSQIVRRLLAAGAKDFDIDSEIKMAAAGTAEIAREVAAGAKGIIDADQVWSRSIVFDTSPFANARYLVDAGVRADGTVRTGALYGLPVLHAMVAIFSVPPLGKRVYFRDIIRGLVDGGADPNGRDREGDTPIMREIKGDPLYGGGEKTYDAIIEDLIAVGADVNAHAKDGKTVLRMAVEHYRPRPSVIKMLKDAGAK